MLLFSFGMTAFFQKNHRLVFYGVWLLLGLIQSGLTELQDDEAYYWAYSRYPDWGYFDHPPMIAFLIKTGYAVFPNELGVRLFPLLLNILSLLIIEKLIDKKNSSLFYCIALSIAVLQVVGFFAVPDIPLLFFTALFFWCYKKFTVAPSFLHTLLLGISVAFLLYSKYHAVLIVFFTLLSNIRLFTRYQTYLAGFIALLFFAPHLWWQYQHDWVSFRFHLFENNAHPYRLSFSAEYIGGQLLLAGPVAGILLLPAAFLYKPKNETEKALRYTMLGIFVFFLFSSFRGKVEANWTIPVLVPLFILSHQYLQEKATKFAIVSKKLLYKLLPATLILVLLARIIMIADIIPVEGVRSRFHAWKEWPAEMKGKTKSLPVVFSSSYQRASKYWFYTGQPTYSQNFYTGRINNYNFWPIEDSFLGKQVYFLDIYDLWRFENSITTKVWSVGYLYDSSFISFAKIKIDVSKKKITLKEGEAVTLNCRFFIPPHYARFIESHPLLKDTVMLGVEDASGWITRIMTPLTLQQMNTQQEATIRIDPHLPKGKYRMRFAIKCGYRNATHNSDKLDLIVE